MEKERWRLEPYRQWALAHGWDEMVYRLVNGRSLRLFVLFPETVQRDGLAPAVVFVHGGGWTGGNAQQYLAHCAYFAQRGAVGISVEYRLMDREHGISLCDCMEDVAAAVAWLREHAAQMGVDSVRIAAMGDSAGAHLLLSLLARDRVYWPNALVNCNGVTDLTGTFLSFVPRQPNDTEASVLERAVQLSPLSHICAGLPPLLNLQGADDKTVLPDETERFHQAYRSYGNDSRYIVWPDTRHAFLVPDYTAPDWQIIRALQAADGFLSGLGFLQAQPKEEKTP